MALLGLVVVMLHYRDVMILLVVQPVPRRGGNANV